MHTQSAITLGCLLSVHVLLPEPSRLDLLLAHALNTRHDSTLLWRDATHQLFIFRVH